MSAVALSQECWVRRWIIPYSQQFKFVFLATGPFTPRWLACWLINVWMGALYRRAGIAHMQPAFGSAHNFTGQCNDALFQLALQACFCHNPPQCTSCAASMLA